MQHMADDGRASALAEAMAQECLGIRISRLHRVVTRRFEQALRPLGLSIPQLEILGYLVVTGAPARPSELADALYAERSTVSRSLAGLQQRGWIEVASTSATGRSMAVTVTADGTAALASARAAWADVQAAVQDRLGPGSADTIDSWLDALTSGAGTGNRRA